MLIEEIEDRYRHLWGRELGGQLGSGAGSSIVVERRVCALPCLIVSSKPETEAMSSVSKSLDLSWIAQGLAASVVWVFCMALILPEMALNPRC